MMWFKRFLIVVMIVAFSMGATSLLPAEDRVLKMATTTSTDNTGLLDYLQPSFKADTGIDWRWCRWS
jgi:tungstate transport system substrate-binding protein